MANAQEIMLPKRRRVSLVHTAGGLPAVIFNLVASGLPAADVIAFCNTNSLYAQQWCQSEQLWRLLFLRDFQSYPMARLRPGESWRQGYRRASVQQTRDEAKILALSKSLVGLLARRFYDNMLEEDDIDTAFAALNTTRPTLPYLAIDFGYYYSNAVVMWPLQQVALTGTPRRHSRNEALEQLLTAGLETKVSAPFGRVTILFGTLRQGHRETDIPIAVANVQRLLRQWAALDVLGEGVLQAYYPFDAAATNREIGVLSPLFSRPVV